MERAADSDDARESNRKEIGGVDALHTPHHIAIRTGDDAGCNAIATDHEEAKHGGIAGMPDPSNKKLAGRHDFRMRYHYTGCQQKTHPGEDIPFRIMVCGGNHLLTSDRMTQSSSANAKPPDE